MLCIYDLPPEVIDLILLHLGFKDVVSCLRAARIFHVVSTPRMQWLRYAITRIGTIVRYDLLDGFKYKVEKLGKTDLLTSKVAFKFTIRFNKPNIMDYMIENGFKPDSSHVNYAIQLCQLDLLQHLLNKHQLTFDIHSPFIAINNCCILQLKELKEIGLEYCNHCVDTAVRRGEYKIVKYLYNIGLRTDTLINAGRGGNIKILKLLLKHGATNKGLALNLAARSGHLAAVKLLYTHGAVGSEFAVQQAACYNHLEIVRYLHFINMPTKLFRTFDCALRGGSVKMCRQLVVMGLSCSKRGVLKVTENGNIAILQYIHRVQRPYFHATELNPLDVAANFGHTSVTHYLRTQGYDYTDFSN